MRHAIQKGYLVDYLGCQFEEFFKIIDYVCCVSRETTAYSGFSLGQGGMHVNGAPSLMQASIQAGVPVPGQIPTAVTGPGPGSLAPGGKFHLQSSPFSYFAKVLL